VNPLVLIFAVLFALAGYQEARRFAGQYGVTPWRWNPWVWAIVMLLSWVIGLILLAIAERQGRRRARQSSTRAWPGVSQSIFAGADSHASLGYAAVTVPAVDTAKGAAMLQTTQTLDPGIGFWAVDPSGRHQYRWWNGREWTADVATNGVQAHDLM
jgi:hypothetical protein